MSLAFGVAGSESALEYHRRQVFSLFYRVFLSDHQASVACKPCEVLTLPRAATQLPYTNNYATKIGLAMRQLKHSSLPPSTLAVSDIAWLRRVIKELHAGSRCTALLIGFSSEMHD